MKQFQIASNKERVWQIWVRDPQGQVYSLMIETSGKGPWSDEALINY